MADCTSERRTRELAQLRSSVVITIGVLVASHLWAETPAKLALARRDALQPSLKVTGVEVTPSEDSSRIAIQVSGEFKFEWHRISDPDRLYFDIPGSRLTSAKRAEIIPVGDGRLRQVRVAETTPGITRIVLDLEPQTPALDYTTSQLTDPHRLIIEVRSRSKAPSRVTPPVEARKEPAILARVAVPERTSIPTRNHQFVPPPEHIGDTVLAPPAPLIGGAPVLASVSKPHFLPLPKTPGVGAPEYTEHADAKPLLPRAATPSRNALEAAPAKRNLTGDRTLTRVLGLKLGRVMIDPGHGGQDVGTHGPTGYLEKDLVLDVSLRLGDLVHERLGSEVVYTRDDDTFIPLEERTRLANENKADLFLSIHANSSSVKAVSGVETYYLNFTPSRTALELAARENAGSGHTLFELRDLLQKIAMKEKIDESREFAGQIQTSLYSISAKTNTAAQNRGIKRAPFVVLIGAHMPSVLAEIGFLTNPADEALLKTPAHRQKIAEALYKGVAAYAETLSHFLAQTR